MPNRFTALNVIFCGVISIACGTARAQAPGSFAMGKAAIESFAGCFLVDYSYTETKSLQPGYVRDDRVYDVNGVRSVKEWIGVTELSPTRLWLQHILYVPAFGLIMKHEAEDWSYEAPYLYAFSGPWMWQRRDITAGSQTWTRRVTNLDDGPRYQCAAPWHQDAATGYPEWSCDTYAPIPGRETRDMGRSDYNTLQRATRVVAYGASWLERQDNIKTRDYDGQRSPLAQELGKNWYVRLPDSECDAVQPFVAERQAFWGLVRDVWDGYFTGDPAFVEVAPVGKGPRWAKMAGLEAKYTEQDLGDAQVRATAAAAIRAVIDAYRQ